MPNFEYDLGYLKAAALQLEDYLLSDVLYWPLGVQSPPGTPSYPRLTLGGMLLVCKRLSVIADNDPLENETRRLVADIDQVHIKWSFNWSEKAAREYQARLTLWRNFIDDYRMDPESQYDRYAFEVGRRVQLELLQGESETIPTSSFELLESMDLILKTLLIPGQFIWDTVFQEGFPMDSYWYLYGNLPSRIE